MAVVTGERVAAPARLETRRAVRDSLIVSLGGQLERVLGTLTALALRWGLDPDRLGVYTGLRLYLDNTNRSSLGVSLGAVQEIPVLRAAGREAEARHIANVAHTTNTLTCLLFAAGLIGWAWFRSPALASSPLGAEWTWGLVSVAGLALLKRYQDFQIAVLRAYQEFALTTRLAVLDALLSAVLVGGGLWLAGFWGLLAAVGLLLGFNIVYLHAQHPMRFGYVWDVPTGLRLMIVGLPILANTAAFGMIQTVDRWLILTRLPEGERALGLYSIAILGTSWSLDLAGRIVMVLYTHFQATLGRTDDPAEVALQAARSAEAQAPLLAAGAAVAYLAGPIVLGALIPKYAEGVPAMRPLLMGMVLLGLAWPARQMLITVGRPYRLCAATLLGLAATTVAGVIGADRAGIVGVAWGMTIGYSLVYLLTSYTALAPWLRLEGWCRHEARLAWAMAPYAFIGFFAAHLPLPPSGRWIDLAARLAILSLLGLPMLWHWGRRHDWGGLLSRGSEDRKGFTIRNSRFKFSGRES